ncbi:MAG: hypothetical protein JW810_13330, partial [Sedimentisphaerales bacterium]|nr:hypothetical protein [Sedimentisphaerales bacterium]
PAWSAELDRYLWQRRVVTGISALADELKSILAETVEAMLDAGHLGPYFTSRGEGNAHWYFQNPGDLIGALAGAYPYLPAGMRPAVLAYMQSEMDHFAPWSDVQLHNSDPGTVRRNRHPLPDAMSSDRRENPWPRLHNCYALWNYADVTDDWQTLEENADAIVAFYEGHRDQRAVTYGQMSGCIGMARIARRLGRDQLVETACRDLQEALARGRDPATMREAAWQAYRLGRGPDDPFNVHGFFCLDLSPELARFINDHPPTRQQVLAVIEEGVWRYPMWFVSQASCFMRLYGESHAITPLYSKMIFPVKALVEQADPGQLLIWVDAEDAPLGDLFFLERLVLAIEAWGQADWRAVE